MREALKMLTKSRPSNFFGALDEGFGAKAVQNRRCATERAALCSREMAWNPQQYLKFAGERQRPGFDLMAQIEDLPPGPIYELGCGAGIHARAMAARWPDHRLQAIDNSADMLIEAAKAPSPILWINADIETWRAPQKAALIFSNATLHWLAAHELLFPRLFGELLPQGILAVQMPRNFDNPSHVLMRETARNGPWFPQLAPLFDPKVAIPSML